MLNGPLLSPGTIAPEFRLLDHSGQSVGMNMEPGKIGTVLLFFASDWLKGDLALLEGYSKSYLALQEAGLEVLALSGINWEKLHYLAKRLQVPFPLVFDPCCRYANRYQAMWVPKFINARAVYGVNAQGKIIFARRQANPTEVIAAFSG